MFNQIYLLSKFYKIKFLNKNKCKMKIKRMNHVKIALTLCFLDFKISIKLIEYNKYIIFILF